MGTDPVKPPEPTAGSVSADRELVEAVRRFLEVCDRYGCSIGRGAGTGHETLDALHAALQAAEVVPVDRERVLVEALRGLIGEVVYGDHNHLLEAARQATKAVGPDLCRGGVLPTEARHGIGTTPNITKPCERCDGSGVAAILVGQSDPDCPSCGGTGEVVVMKGGSPRIMDNPDWKP